MNLTGFIIVILICAINQSESSFDQIFEMIGSLINIYDGYAITKDLYITKTAEESWAGAIAFCTIYNMEVASVGPSLESKYIIKLVNKIGNELVEITSNSFHFSNFDIILLLSHSS